MELHTAAIQGFFTIPVDHLFAKPVFAEYFQKFNSDDMVVVSPDAGGVERARAYGKLLDSGATYNCEIEPCLPKDGSDK